MACVVVTPNFHEGIASGPFKHPSLTVYICGLVLQPVLKPVFFSECDTSLEANCLFSLSKG